LGGGACACTSRWHQPPELVRKPSGEGASVRTPELNDATRVGSMDDCRGDGACVSGGQPVRVSTHTQGPDACPFFHACMHDRISGPGWGWEAPGVVVVGPRSPASKCGVEETICLSYVAFSGWVPPPQCEKGLNKQRVRSGTFSLHPTFWLHARFRQPNPPRSCRAAITWACVRNECSSR
jgi:hypothetical protein